MGVFVDIRHLEIARNSCSRIANYNPDDDDYFAQKNGKGFGDAHSDMNDERPICEQPGRQTTPHIR